MKTPQQAKLEEKIEELKHKHNLEKPLDTGNPGRDYIERVIDSIEQSPGVLNGSWLSSKGGVIDIQGIIGADFPIVEAYFRAWGWKAAYNNSSYDTGIVGASSIPRNTFRIEPL